MKIVVVYDGKTKKIYPHTYDKNGEIVVVASGIVNSDTLLVGNVDVEEIDMFNWYIVGKAKE